MIEIILHHHIEAGAVITLLAFALIFQIRHRAFF